MKNLIAVIAALCAAIVSLPTIGEERPSLNCDIGPAQKTFGKTDWLVYSCNDGRSIALISAPGNPATPFVFMFFPEGNAYRLHGEGTGRKEATVAAFEELKTFSEREIKALIEQTQLAGKAQHQNPDVEVEELGTRHYLLTLKKSKHIPVEAGQRELTPTAKAVCKDDTFLYGKYRFEGSEPIAPAAGKSKRDAFVLKQEVHCGVTVEPSVQTARSQSNSKWSPSPKDEKLIEQLTHEYLTAKDHGDYRKAFLLQTNSVQGIVPFDRWRTMAQEFNTEAGKVKKREIKKITWYKDPPSAAPGIYAAADLSSRFANIDIHCGFIGWQQQRDGSFKIVREEQNFIDKKQQQKMDEKQLASAKAKFGMGCQ